MSGHVRTASACRRAAGTVALGALSAAAATSIGLAAPAAADTSSFLDSLQPRYIFLSESQLLSEGNRVCAASRSGVPASEIVVRVSKDIGSSLSAASEIVKASVIHLGC